MKVLQSALQRRQFVSAQSSLRLFSSMETFKASELEIRKTTSLKAKPAKDHVYTFGGISTDYMLDVDYDEAKGGWQRPVIRQNEDFMLDPMNATLHFSIECFEGLKAYKTDDDKVLIYRPDRNFMRMNSSHKQLGLPSFDPEEMTKCLVELLRLDQDWIPKRDLHSLYIRPTGISMENTFEVGRSKKAKVFVVLSPVGKYYPRGFVPVKLLCDTKYIRAWPKGFGDKKVGGNYAPTIKSGSEAAAANCDQVLWLLHDQVTEVGTMNFFVYWKNKDGENELVTPSLDGTILPGVTRDSILTLMKEKNEFKVSERPFTIQDLTEACTEGRVHEAFGAGTAAVVCPVKELVYQGKNFHIPIDEEKGAGPLTQEVLKKMTDLQYGRVSRPEWQVIV